MERGRQETDYRKLQLSKASKLRLYALLAGCGAALGQLFYRHPAGALAGALLSVKSGYPAVVSLLVRRRQNRLLRQFLNFLELWESALAAGENIRNALCKALHSLEMIYPPDAMMVAETAGMVMWLRNGKELAEVFTQFSDRSGLDPIQDFASVFRVIDGKGEQDRLVIRRTQQLIRETLAVEMEIETLLTAVRTEQAVMLAIPILVMGYMRFFGGDLWARVYDTFAGRLLATGALLITWASSVLSRRLGRIEV